MGIHTDAAHYYSYSIDQTPWVVGVRHLGDDKGWDITLHDNGRARKDAILHLNQSKIGDRDYARNLAFMVAKAIEYVEGNRPFARAKEKEHGIDQTTAQSESE